MGLHPLPAQAATVCVGGGGFCKPAIAPSASGSCNNRGRGREVVCPARRMAAGQEKHGCQKGQGWQQVSCLQTTQRPCSRGLLACCKSHAMPHKLGARAGQAHAFHSQIKQSRQSATHSGLHALAVPLHTKSTVLETVNGQGPSHKAGSQGACKGNSMQSTCNQSKLTRDNDEDCTTQHEPTA